MWRMCSIKIAHNLSQIVVGINSALTQSGSNENLRLLDWKSSGYKPSSQTSTVEKLTDAVKENIKNDAPDVDVQEIKQISKFQSLQIKDLEQYVVRSMVLLLRRFIALSASFSLQQRVVVVSPNGKLLAAGGTDGQVRIGKRRVPHLH